MSVVLLSSGINTLITFIILFMLDIMFYCNHELSFILHRILYNYLQYNNKKKI